jgi:hypothetical protein
VLPNVHKRFGIALLREALKRAGVVHVDYRIDQKPQWVEVWGPRRSDNDTTPPLPPRKTFNKALLATALESAGLVAERVRVGTEPDWLDVYFEPDDAGKPAPGLLGAMTRSASLLEPFYLKPDEHDAQSTVRKAINLWTMQGRIAKAARKPRPEMPISWLVVTEPLGPLLEGLGLRREAEWPSGVYFGPPMFAIRAVVLRELPPTRDTLLVRLLGTGTVLEAALAEQAVLPPNAVERRAVRAALRAVVASQDGPVPLEEANTLPLVRACRRAYLRWARQLIA